MSRDMCSLSICTLEQQTASKSPAAVNHTDTAAQREFERFAKLSRILRRDQRVQSRTENYRNVLGRNNGKTDLSFR